VTRTISYAVCCLALLAVPALAAEPDGVLVPGVLRITGSDSALVFPDGTSQTTATLQGPQGPPGPRGLDGGPQVFDSNGVSLGTYLGYYMGSITILSNGAIFSVNAVTGTYDMPIQYGLYFADSKCATAAYTQAVGLPQTAFTLGGSSVGDAVYVWHGAPSMIAYLSYTTSVGACDASQSGTAMLSPVTVIGTVPAQAAVPLTIR